MVFKCVRSYMECPVLISADKYLSQRAVYFGRLKKDIIYAVEFLSEFFVRHFIEPNIQARFIPRWYARLLILRIYIENVLRSTLRTDIELGYWNIVKCFTRYDASQISFSDVESI